MVNMAQSGQEGNADQWLKRMHNLGQENQRNVENIDMNTHWLLWVGTEGTRVVDEAVEWEKTVVLLTVHQCLHS